MDKVFKITDTDTGSEIGETCLSSDEFYVHFELLLMRKVAKPHFRAI